MKRTFAYHLGLFTPIAAVVLLLAVRPAAKPQHPFPNECTNNAQGDSLALVEFFNSTWGDSLWARNGNWLEGDLYPSSGPPNNELGWFGVQTIGGRVHKIDLANNGLDGEIPLSFACLDKVQFVFLQNNKLRGNLPDSLSKMRSLKELNVESNELGGTIPRLATTIAKLILNDNDFTGSIPAHIGDAQDLIWLFLKDNQFSGAIPAELGNLSKLQQLFVNLNNLTGSIPPELGQLASLTRLDLGNNRSLTGTLPASLFELPNLQNLWVFAANLTGLPDSVAKPSGSIEQIVLGSNGLSGSIPTWLGEFPILKRLELQANAFIGPVPAELEALSLLEVFKVSDNRLSALPNACAWPNLQAAWVHGNELTFDHIERLYTCETHEIPEVFAHGQSRLVPASGIKGVNEGSVTVLALPENTTGGVHNQYGWTKGFDPIAGATRTLTVQNARLTDQGLYQLTITNTLVPEVVLESEPILLLVHPLPRFVGQVDSVLSLVFGEPWTVDLATLFEGNELSFEAISANEGTVAATVVDNTLEVELLRADVPLTAVTISAITRTNGRTDTTLQVVSNQRPMVRPGAAIADTVVAEGGTRIEYDLSRVFIDPDRDRLVFAASSDNPLVIEAFTVDSLLIVQEIKPEVGKAARIEVSARDDKGASERMTFEVRVDELPDIADLSIQNGSPTNPPDLVTGNDVLLTVSVSDNTAVSTVVASYRNAGDVDFTMQPMVLEAGTRYLATVPGTQIGTTGFEYYVEATDEFGLKVQRPGRFASEQVRVTDLEAPDMQPVAVSGSEERAYRLISIPLDLDEKNPRRVLENVLGDYDNTRWAFYQHHPSGDPQQYLEMGDTEEMSPGRAFWLLVTENVQLRVGSGLTVPTDRDVEIRLGPGQTAIGNPFNYAIPVGNLRIVGASPDDPPLTVSYYSDGQWTDETESLHPFKGYIVQNLKEVDADLRISAISRDSTSSREISPSRQPHEWTINVVARCGDLIDHNNLAGVAKTATTGLDRLDRAELPLIGNYVSVHFSQPEWHSVLNRFRHDIRPTIEDGEVWPVEVVSTVADRVELTFEGVDKVPSHLDVWLIDRVAGITTDLRAEATYVLGSGAEQARSLQLVVGTSAFVGEALRQASETPASVVLDPNFPNPFSGVTTMRYGLPEPASVTMEVYDVLGRRVVVLEDGNEKHAGYHAVVWDGTGAAGETVSSGVYFARLNVDGVVRTLKLVLAR